MLKFASALEEYFTPVITPVSTTKSLKSSSATTLLLLKNNVVSTDYRRYTHNPLVLNDVKLQITAVTH